MNILGEGSEETKEASSLEFDEKAVGVEPSEEDCEELAWVDNQIMDTMKAVSLLDKSMISTSDVC